MSVEQHKKQWRVPGDSSRSHISYGPIAATIFVLMPYLLLASYFSNFTNLASKASLTVLLMGILPTGFLYLSQKHEAWVEAKPYRKLIFGLLLVFYLPVTFLTVLALLFLW
jgi:hypothetical protein